MATPKRSKLRQSALKAGFRSGLEQDNAKHIEEHGDGHTYEEFKIKYVGKPRTYTPDFRLSNGIIIETKGRFIPSDRTKHLLVKEQHPELDIRFVFSNSNQRLSKTSSTTYGGWCERHGFLYADHLIPQVWMWEFKS